MKIFKLLVILQLFFSRILGQFSVDPHVNVGSAVLIQSDSGYASGFLVQDSAYSYLVTSRHSFIGVKKTRFYTDFYLTNNSFNVTTYNESEKYNEQFSFRVDNLRLLYDQGNLKFDSVHDVVVIRFGKNYENGFTTFYPIIRTSKNIRCPEAMRLNKFVRFDSLDIGQPICTVGYPKSLGLQDVPQYNFNYPLLRKGIIAGIDSLNGNIIIDCPCYRGNSGGPVFQLIKFMVNGGGTTYNLIGLVSEFIPYKEDKYDSNLNIRDTFIWNSGYSVVTPADYILNLITQFPSSH